MKNEIEPSLRGIHAVRNGLLTILLAAAALPFVGCSGGSGGGASPAAATSSGGGAASGGSSGGTGASTGTGAGTSGSGSGASGGGATTSSTSAFQDFAALRASIASLATAAQQARLDAFIAAKEVSVEGFPLRSGTRAAFVFKGRPAHAPIVAGDWDGWNSGQIALAEIGQTDVWFVEADLGTADRHEYKLVVDGSWQSDPLNRKFTYDHVNSIANLAGSGKSHLELIPAFASTALNNTRDVIVYLPAGYLDDAAARYPVLYLHDGQNVFDPDAMWGGWLADQALDGNIASGAIKKIIAVGAANTPGRMDEYTQVQDEPFGCGSGVSGGKAPRYARFIVNELKPWVDARYQTLPDRENTAILGSSLGGLVSVYIGYAYPQVFKRVGGMSSTFDWGSWCLHNPTVLDQVRAAGKQDFLLYIDTGGGPNSASVDNYAVTVQFKQLVEGQGFVAGTDLLYYWDQNAPHNEQSWAGRLWRPLQFWFHK